AVLLEARRSEPEVGPELADDRGDVHRCVVRLTAHLEAHEVGNVHPTPGLERPCARLRSGPQVRPDVELAGCCVGEREVGSLAGVTLARESRQLEATSVRAAGRRVWGWAGSVACTTSGHRDHLLVVALRDSVTSRLARPAKSLPGLDQPEGLNSPHLSAL